MSKEMINDKAIETFEQEMSQKTALTKSINELIRIKNDLQRSKNSMSIEVKDIENKLSTLLSEYEFKSRQIAFFEKEMEKKHGDFIKKLSEKEASLDQYIKDYQRIQKDNEDISKTLKEQKKELDLKLASFHKEKSESEEWLKKQLDSITLREQKYAEDQSKVKSQTEDFIKLKESAEKAKAELDKKDKATASEYKAIALQKENLDKQKQANDALKIRLEAEHKEAMNKVVALKASVEQQKEDVLKEKEANEEKRLNLVALENRVNALIKRYNLEKEANA